MGLVEKPMAIQFFSGQAPKIAVKLEELGSKDQDESPEKKRDG